MIFLANGRTLSELELWVLYVCICVFVYLFMSVCLYVCIVPAAPVQILIK